jgi:hypothetical protein
VTCDRRPVLERLGLAADGCRIPIRSGWGVVCSKKRGQLLVSPDVMPAALKP